MNEDYEGSLKYVLDNLDSFTRVKEEPEKEDEKEEEKEDTTQTPEQPQ